MPVATALILGRAFRSSAFGPSTLGVLGPSAAAPRILAFVSVVVAGAVNHRRASRESAVCVENLEEYVRRYEELFVNNRTSVENMEQKSIRI